MMSLGNPTLRLATTDADRAKAYRLRYELYVEGQGLFHDEADHENRLLWDEYDEKSVIILAEDDGRCVGTSRMTFGADTRFTKCSREHYDFAHFGAELDDEDFSVITRLMVLPEYRGGDLGTRLFAKSFELAAVRGAELVLGSCELHLINHYRPLGFRPFGRLANHSCNGVLVRIALVVGDLDYVRQMHSPMTEALSRRIRSNENVPGILRCLEDSRSLWSEANLGADSFLRELLSHVEATSAPELFSDLDAAQSARLFHKAHLLQCAAGDALFYDGQASRTLYILLSGSVEIHDPATGVRHVDRPGALVGEVALLGSSRRFGDVIVGMDGAAVVALNDRTLRQMFGEGSELTTRFLLYAARELSLKLTARPATVVPASLVPASAPSQALAPTLRPRRGAHLGHVVHRFARRPRRAHRPAVAGAFVRPRGSMRRSAGAVAR